MLYPCRRRRCAVSVRRWGGARASSFYSTITNSKVVLPTVKLGPPFSTKLDGRQYQELLAERGCEVSYSSLRRFIQRRGWRHRQPAERAVNASRAADAAGQWQPSRRSRRNSGSGWAGPAGRATRELGATCPGISPSPFARQATNRDELRRIEVLRRIFSGDLLPQAENALGEIRDLRLEGRVLRIRLEALRERYRLNVPDDSDTARPPEPEVIRIVCSDGLG